MTNSLVPKPFDIRDAKRAREEAARLAERRDGAAWSGTGEVAKAVEAETVAREELAELTEAEQQAIREQVVKEALERAEAFIDVNRTLDALDVKYDGVITDAGQIGAKLTQAEADIKASKGRLDVNDTTLGTLTGTTLPALQTSLDTAKAELAPLPGKVADNATKLATAQGQLTTLKDTTIPALAADLNAAKGRLATAEDTLSPLPGKLATAQSDLNDAFGQLNTVDTRVAAAKAAAITAAAADAKSQAEAAEARAAITAATDAKLKADAAQAAALLAAKTYADAQASGASGDALAAAKADATAKANAAQAAAISAAALDATAKKEQAEANAALDAKAKADKALADAKLDATSKADAAREAAKVAAAADATTKADAAKKVATDAQAAANKAQADALSAAGLAGSKGKVWFQPEAPSPDLTHGWMGAVNNSESVKALNGTGLRRNLFIDPRSTVLNRSISRNRWFGGNPGAGTVVIIPDGTVPDGVGSHIRKTWTVTPPQNGDTGFDLTHIPVVEGQVIHLGGYLRSSAAGKYGVARLQFRTAAGTNLPQAPQKSVPLNTGEWIWLENTGTAPANAALVVPILDISAAGAPWAVGEFLDATMVLLEVGTTGGYFDGNTPDDREFDLWVDTDDGNKPYRWDHATKAWKEATDQQIVAAAAAAALADGKAAKAQTDATKAIGDAATAKSVADKATTDILAIPAKIETAKQAAIDAAALVAEAKATAAQSAATTAAAADAKSKADAAQAAAIVAAKTATDLAASGAKQEAIDAAKADATSKANAAQMAAVNAAAADATAKANQAKTDAITTAANDSTTKANNAKADAVTAAATDATAKANQARTDAVATATTMTNGIGKNLSSTAAPTTSNAAPQGSMWRRMDTSGRVIGVWEQTAAGVGSTWTPRLITSDVVDNLDVGKLSASSASINSVVVSKLAAQVATVIELNADRITSGLVTSTQIDAQSLAVAIASIIQLNADRITAGTIDTARLNVTTLAASIATIIKLNASAITAGTIDTARLNVTTLAANLATILSLNADRITAGTINTARLNVVAIAAATAAFQTVDIKNLFASSGTLDEAVIAKLWADVVNSKKITTQMMAIGAFDNLIPDPDFTNTNNEWGAEGGVYSFSATEGYLGSGAFKIAPNASQSGKYSTRIPAAGKASYRVTVWVKANTAIPAAGLGLYTNRKATATSAATNPSQWLKQSNGAGGNDPIAANTWVKLSAVIDIPDGAYDFAVGLYTQTVFSGGTVWFSQPSCTRMNGGELTIDGTVVAQQLEAELALLTKIIAGDPAGTHAEMSPLGFKVFASPAGGGAPTEVVRLGVAATDDYFAITKANGDLAASISQNGVISGEEVNATNAIWYKGDELQTILDRMPRGIVSAGYRATSSSVNATYGNIIPYLRIEATLYPGRIYKVWTSGIKIGLDAGTRVTVGIKYTNTGFASISSNGLTETATDTDLSAPVVQELFAVGTEQTVSFLLYLQVLNSGQAGFRGTASVPTRLVVEDAGPFTSQIGNGVHMNGVATGPPPTPPAAVNTYRKQYGSIGSMNYQGNNAQYNYNTGQMYQGLSPAGMGNLKSISLHPSMVGDLSGATINYIRVYFGFNHWFYNAGGTARIGLHGHASIPGSFSGSGIAATSYGWPRPGARWVDLPSSVFAGFKSGAYKGIYLEGDGTYGTYGIADRPTIEIGFTK